MPSETILLHNHSAATSHPSAKGAKCGIVSVMSLDVIHILLCIQAN